VASLRALAEEVNAAKHGGELQRLRTENAFLTQRALLLDAADAPQRRSSDGGLLSDGDQPPSAFWLPTTEVEGANVQTTASELLRALERMAPGAAEAERGSQIEAQVGSATRLFWKLVGTTTVLQQRLVAARAELLAVHRRADEAEAACRWVFRAPSHTPLRMVGFDDGCTKAKDWRRKSLLVEGCERRETAWESSVVVLFWHVLPRIDGGGRDVSQCDGGGTLGGGGGSGGEAYA
jgi:hypothetical protein